MDTSTQSSQPGPHQSSTPNPDTHAQLHPAAAAATTTTDKRTEPRDAGEKDQHAAEKAGYVPAARRTKAK